MAASLPHDVIINILLFLPVKTLLRFKSTCKSWLSTIQSQQFIKTHRDLQIINQDKKILLAASTLDKEYYCYSILEKSYRLPNKSLVEHEIDFLSCSKLPEEYLNESACIEYMSCCHGLVLMVIFDGRMILWNPTTRKHNQIPPYKHPGVRPLSDYIGGDNPLVRRLNYFYVDSGPAYCFGYDSSVDDYKILRLKSENRGLPSCVDMYSLNNKSWKTLGLLSSDHEFPPQDPIIFGGAFHFLYHPRITNARLPVKGLMMSCCLLEEKLIERYVPQVEKGCYILYKNLCVVEQRLSISGFTVWGSNSKFEVWSLMNHEKNCWSRTISIQLELPMTDVFGRIMILSSRFVVEREVLLFQAHDQLSHCKGYIIYDTRKQQFFKIMGFPRCRNNGGMVKDNTVEFPPCGMAKDYVETLMCP